MKSPKKHEEEPSRKKRCLTYGPPSKTQILTRLALFVRGKPLSHDVGVGERAVGHRRKEEHGGRGEAVHIELTVKALDKVVYYAWGKTMDYTRKPLRRDNGSCSYLRDNMAQARCHLA